MSHNTVKAKKVPCEECLVYAACKCKKGTVMCDNLYNWFKEELRLSRNKVIDVINKHLPNCDTVGKNDKEYSK